MGHLVGFPLNDDGSVGTSIFDSGTLLKDQAANTRVMYTAVKQGQNLVRTDFTTANASTLRTLVNPDNEEIDGVAPAGSVADAQTIISFIREPGYNNGQYRGARNLPPPSTLLNWKLQDIFHSTPRIVGPPLPLAP
jgi:hypothetical protein